VVGYAKQIRLIAGNHVGSEPGALGDALHRAGLVTAVVGNADAPGSDQASVPEVNRPVAMALVGRTAAVGRGEVGADLLRRDPAPPFGVRFDAARVLAETRRALRDADVIAVDPGDLDRAFAFRPLALDRAVKREQARALRRTDALLGRIVADLPSTTLVL